MSQDKTWWLLYLGRQTVTVLSAGTPVDARREHMPSHSHGHDDWRSRADALFAGLDARAIECRARTWVTQVLGIHRDARHLWVQVAPADAIEKSVVLRVPPRATARQALAALTSAISTDDYPDVIPVMEIVKRGLTHPRGSATTPPPPGRAQSARLPR
jgi:hypothetical protein